MNKSKALLMSLAFTTVFALTACGSKNNNEASSSQSASAPAATESASESAEAPADDLKAEDGATLVVWESKEFRENMDKVAKAFTEQYNIPVKVEEVNEPDQVNKLINDGPAGVGADVVIFPHDNLGKAVSAGLLLENDYFQDVTTSENSEASVKAFTFQDVLYGYPRSVETYALFYNKKLIPEPPKSYDEVIEFAKTFNKNGQYAMMWEITNFYYAYQFLATPGGYVFGKNGSDANDIGLNNEGAIKGAQMFQKLKSILPMKAADATFDVKKGLFTSGKLALDINGPWAIADLKKEGIDFGIAPLPTIDGKANVSFSGVKGFAVSSFTKYPNAAKLFARFASTKENQLLYYSELGFLPSNNEAAADPAVTADPLVVGILEQFKNSYPMPAIPEMGNVWGAGQAALTDIWDNNKDPKEALDNAVKQIQEANAATK
ncbi:maltose ABC transporter substrate-binding protein [Cohnella endophytica]|uniref:Maltodextrin-binding protein n=1 Tax=Cohnella endophytica TaxID=2419778 RepID=A0A494Y2Q2_9BACL|nr:maltose ABC transporter substrate-binding protein [Cohnella endophytica]RKP54166.1 maltose ABC transporter substrate-binding protein [Cohnella endophytica]